MTAVRPTVVGYFRYLLTPFFWPWWALFGGVASIASWYGIPVSGFTISKWAAPILVTLVCASLFLLVSVLWRGWKLYLGAMSQIAFVGIQASDFYDGEHVVLLSCGMALPSGTLVELKRTHNGVEVAIALVEVRDINSSAQLQAHPVWFGSGHLNELMRNTLNHASVKATMAISRRAAQKAAPQLVQFKEIE